MPAENHAPDPSKMKASEKLEKARSLARVATNFGFPSLLRAEAHPSGDSPYVKFEMNDGLSFNVPWDFNPDHLDTIIAISSISKLKGKEEAMLEAMKKDSKLH